MNSLIQVLEHQEPQKLLWFEFSQNNSGGYYVEDDDVCEVVYIQAHTASEAIEKARRFCNNSDSCACCGDRWSFWVDDNDGTVIPMHYGEPLEFYKPDYFFKKAKLHKFDGTVVTFVLGDGVTAGRIEGVKC